MCCKEGYVSSKKKSQPSIAQTKFTDHGMNWKYLATISQIGYLEYNILQKQSR